MGCDIHLVLERKTEEGWLGIHNFPYYPHEEGPSFSPARNRNYRRFAALAGVRGDGPAPKGVPEDASELTRHEVAHLDADGHSHSWLSVRDAARVFIDTEYVENARWKDHPAYHYFGLWDDEVDAHRLVFWFDN